MAIVTTEQLENASLDCETVELAVNGADDVDVTSRLGAVYPTIPKALRLIVENGLLGATPVPLASTLTGGYGTDGQFVVVHDDPETDNNVIWEKQAGVWVKSKYNTLPAAKAYIDSLVNTPSLAFRSPIIVDNAGVVTITAFDAITVDAVTAHLTPYLFTPTEFGRAYVLYYDLSINDIALGDARTLEQTGDLALIGIAYRGQFVSQYDVVYPDENNVITKLPNQILNGALDPSNPLDNRYVYDNPISFDNSPIVAVNDTALSAISITRAQKLDASTIYNGGFGQAQFFRRKLRSYKSFLAFIAHDPTSTFAWGTDGGGLAYITKLNADASNRITFYSASVTDFVELSSTVRLYYLASNIELNQTTYPDSYIERVLIGARLGTDAPNPIYISGFWCSYTDKIKGFGSTLTLKDIAYPNFERVASESVFEYLHSKSQTTATNELSTAEALKEQLEHPLKSARIRLIGDSITWGTGSSNPAVSTPRNHALADPRNNLTNQAWANQLRKYLANKYFELDVIQDLADGRGGSLSEKVYKISIANALKQGIARYVDPFYKKDITPILNESPSESSTFWEYLDLGSTNTGQIEVEVHGDNLTLVWASLSPVGAARTFTVYVDDVEYGTYSYNVDLAFGNETVISLSYGTHKVRVKCNTPENGLFRFEGFYHTKKLWLWNDGIIGTNTEEWLPSVNTLYQAIENTDDFVLMQLGTNDRGGGSGGQLDIVSKSVKNQRLIVEAIKARNINVIMMCANAVTQDQATYDFTQGDIAVALADLAKELNVSFIDNYSATLQAKLNNVSFLSDDLHPNDVGHTLIYSNIIEKLGIASNTTQAIAANDASIKAGLAQSAAITYAASINKKPNVLFDSFNEYVYVNANAFGWDWLVGSTPSFSTSTANMPLKTPKYTSTGVLKDKAWDFNYLGLKAGDIITVAVMAYFADVGGKIDVYLRQIDGTVLASAASLVSTVAGVQILQCTLTVPAGSIHRLVIRASSGTTTAFEVGAYSVAIGEQRAEFTSAPLPKDYIDAQITSVGNLLFDPFNESVNAQTKGDSLQSVRSASFTSLSTTSVNSSFGKPTLIASSGTALRRYIDVKKLGLKAGDKIRVKVVAYHANLTGANVAVYLRTSADAPSASYVFPAPTAIGTNEYLTPLDLTIQSTTDHILIDVGGASTRELVAIAVGRSGIPDINYGGANASTLTAVINDTTNYCPDPFYASFDAGVTLIDGNPIVDSTYSVVDFAASPFARKRAILAPEHASARNKNIKIDRLGLKLGEKITCRVGIVIPVGGSFSLAAYFRRTDTTVIELQNATTVTTVANEYTELAITLTVTSAVISDAATLQIRVNADATLFAGGYYICGWAVYKNTSARIVNNDYTTDELRNSIAITQTSIATAQSDIDTLAATIPEVPKYQHGEWYLREFRQRTQKLKLGDAATQLHVAAIGDSWTQNKARWTGALANSLVDKFGDASGGWMGFGFAGDGGSIKNGSAYDDYTFAFYGTGWTSSYANSVSPDLCHAANSTVGAGITVTLPASPDLNDAVLFYVATSDGQIRYRWNGGTWTTTDVQGVIDDLETLSLTGFSTGANTLDIEVVAGTCKLAGMNFKASTNGAVLHKLAASGSRASQWAAINAARWTSGLSALGINTFLIMFGTNDQTIGRSVTQFADDHRTIIDNIRSVLPLADIVIVMPAENQRGLTPTMAQYSAAIYDVCLEKKCGFLDLQYVFGDVPSEYASTSARNWFNADGIHPDPLTGARAIVDAVERFLLY